MRLKNQNVNPDGSLRLKYVEADEVKEEPKKKPKKNSRKKKGEK